MGTLTTIFMMISLVLVLTMMFFGFKGIAGPRRNPRDEAPGERTLFRRARKTRPRPPMKNADDSQRAA